MAAAVYILCALTSIACAVLLLRGYAQRKVRLLLWSGLCFAALAANNILLFVDLVVIRSVDLSSLRHLTALIGLALLLYGLIWDLRE
ncbi:MULTISPECIES: DUF5985 family protein [Sorangium]|uniref:Uncharacterized protein n=1 Tax=Sorangium cellulosum TaxID=56 RepID=A1YBU5_SORCE|nr:hypothetical protein [Sorangium cellulosum]